MTPSIPVDLKSPGQVLACMGFLEAAEVLLGGVEAHFDWSEAQATFVLRADGDKNPFVAVLEFLSKAKISELTPIGYVEGGAADADDDGKEDTAPIEAEGDEGADGDDPGEAQGRVTTPAFPAGEGERNALPIRLVAGGRCLAVSHWTEARKSPHTPWLSRDDFKLYSGNRSANRIATQMLQGVRAKSKKNQSIGEFKNRGLQQLWQENRAALLRAPFDVVTPMGGSFNFDPRGAWTAIDAGYSPNTQKDAIAASPVVEILAAIGLEHARPDQYETRKVRYVVWGHPMPPMLARVALVGADLKVPMRRFAFELDLSGKNKIVTFAQEETQP
jgi:CRISPR-associated protein Csx14